MDRIVDVKDEIRNIVLPVFLKKGIELGNVIPINENGIRYVLVFGYKDKKELIFRIDVEEQLYFRDANKCDWLKIAA